MKKTAIIFGILLITVLNVNSQIRLADDNKSVIISETQSLDLYNSVFSDFNTYSTCETILEENEDLEMQDIYSDLYEENKLREQIVKEMEQDSMYERIYAELFGKL
jgi:hypothetical protein